MSQEFKKIGFYTKSALDIINAAIHAWSKRHQRTWLAHHTIALFDEKLAPSGEIVIANTGYYGNRVEKIEMVAYAIKEMLYYSDFYYKDADNVFRPYCSWKPNEKDILKNLREKATCANENVKLYLKSYRLGFTQWSRKPEPEREGTEFVEINSKDAWFMYDYILGHRKSTLQSKYGLEAIERIVGTPRNPMEIEQLKLYSSQIQEAENSFVNDCNKLDMEMRTKLDEIRQKYAQLKKDREVLHTKTIAKIEAAFNQMKELMNAIPEAGI